jgi:hypothetical protein
MRLDWGGSIGYESACTACYFACKGTGKWPDFIWDGSWGEGIKVSCDYTWKYVMRSK